MGEQIRVSSFVNLMDPPPLPSVAHLCSSLPSVTMPAQSALFDGDTNEAALTSSHEAAAAAGATAVPPSMRQSMLLMRLEAEEGEGGGVTLCVRLSVQFFLDYMWVLVTELDREGSAEASPGVVLRFDPGRGTHTRFLFNGETPTLECTVLMGMRDHPLTNLVASTLGHAVKKFGEERSMLMCVSVARTAKALRTVEQRRRFLNGVRAHVMALAAGAPPPEEEF